MNRRSGTGSIVKRCSVRARATQITDLKRQAAIYDGQFSIQRRADLRKAAHERVLHTVQLSGIVGHQNVRPAKTAH